MKTIYFWIVFGVALVFFVLGIIGSVLFLKEFRAVYQTNSVTNFLSSTNRISFTNTVTVTRTKTYIITNDQTLFYATTNVYTNFWRK